ncbi:hypothetical protein EYY60_02830 [Flavobacterium zhairuonense]|uniref:RHS repeat-associated core domain-containing protein n=1 Tax=Flavobacterium zhairuonense TaxID=2493631 RepID=UPI00104F4685|nr:RHS repeat-associated core domain-containing protein [Flavobacterium zhairuonense]KAF2515009.1 hypothetical protein EYY60_02830 [Flavobacterium zhairuonense]
MKKFYIFILTLISHLSFSQNFTDTKGELQISASGTATYTLPIATPPSIKNVAPIINLTYSSGVRGGIAGQGWSINSISTISRMATRRDIDGFVDGVDFDDNDKLALDGQRLLIKTGTYWASGSTYETEYKSNTKIELKIEGTTTYFIVTAPDGSRSWYGSKGSGSLQNSVSLNAWYIVHYEDTYGNFIDYNYETVTYNNTNQLYISNIVFSGNTAAGIAAQDKISFFYRNSLRVERDYLKGVPVYASKILDNIKVYADNTLFRTYQLTHIVDPGLGYERVASIKEINAQSEESNPVVFTYGTSPNYQERTEKEYTNNLSFDKTDLAGDFDGDGRLDFIVDNKLFKNLFQGSSGNEPIYMPLYAMSGRTFSATTLTNDRLNQFNSIIDPVADLNSLTFNYYNLNNNSVNLVNTKTVAIQNIVANEIQCTTGGGGGEEQSRGVATTASTEYPDKVNLNNQYLEGDFNGDGISEVIILQHHQVDHYGMDGPCTGPHGEALNCNCILKESSVGNCISSAYYLNLAPNASTVLNTKDFVLMSDFSYCKEYENRFTADFNGDGKTDILFVDNTTKNYRIASLRQLNTAPWIAVEIIGTGNLDQYSKTKQILFGDYNGDGKTDVMLPTSEGGNAQVQWNIYYSNGNPSGGEFFTKQSLDIVEYRPDTTKETPMPFTTQAHYSGYFAIDINKDGKSDLVRVWRRYYKDDWSINNHDTQWQVTGFINNIGMVGVDGFSAGYNSGVFTSNSPDVPIPIPSNFKFNGANTDLIVVRAHYNKIEYYQFNKNVDAENRMVTVSESGGNIVQTVEYKSMEASDNAQGNASSDFYSSSNSVTYPNVEIIRNANSFLVSKLTATINGISKYQNFRYRGYVSNFNYGTVGFIRTTRSSWYVSDSDTKLWTTQHNDVALKGANTITWSSTNGSTVFDSTPTNLLSTKINEFAVSTTGGDQPWNTYQNDITITSAVASSQSFIANNSVTASSAVNDNLNVNYQSSQVVLKPGFSAKGTSGSSFKAYTLVPAGTAAPANTSVYNILLTKQTSIDHLTDTKIETTFTYDGTVQSTNYFGLETKSVTKTFSGATLQGTTTVDTQYDSNPLGIGINYYVGRPKKVNKSTNIYTGDTRTSEEVYSYSGLNLVKTEKKGHNTYAVVEEMSYDALGNLLTKTVSAPAAPTPLPSRTIKDEYDATKRFVVKKTDHQNFVTNFEYNSLGQVKKSTDYMGIVNDFVYDNWGKLLTTTVTNSSAVPIVTTNAYAKLSTGGYTLTTTNNLEAKTITEYDVLGRTVKSSTKGFATNSIISKQVVYDAVGRKEKESEPYFSSPSLWTSYEYDYLMRPTKVTAPTGKIQSISYSGLTTTSNDDGKTTTATVNALGNKVQTTDPGGTINFIYFADGQLKESDYQGNKVQIDIDGWGNKITMIDPSAGTYTYSYDAYGQLKTETTPNGTTSLVYDAAGKLTEKTIVGTNTNSKTTYAYNGLNQITSSSFVDNTESKTITNSYEYDNLKRLSKTTETTPYAVFVKELAFDSLGRIDKETSTATASGKTSAKTIKNTYQNGFPWQIVDDATQQVLWQANSVNERGQLLTGTFGNGIAVTNGYDQYGYVTQIKHEKTNPSVVNIMMLNTSFEIKRGNLNSRTNSLFSRNESFKYDNLDRLTEFTNGQGVQEGQIYDDRGRITQNSVGTYEYDGTKTYQNKAITPTPEALSYYTARPTQIISYNTFKSPVQIEETGVDKISFTYNDGNDRSSMFYGGLQTDKLQRIYRKHYSADGTMEIKQNITTGAIEFVTYIGGDGYSAPVVLKSNGTTQNYLYLHRDYQGTIVAISDQAGAVVEKRLFDAWGSLVKVQDGAGNILTGLTVLDRGYTGHEHLQSVGIIHMNGRLYDPKLHRFLQPDNYVQEPFNTQNYNKYAYVLNNPLKYTDSSGEFAEIGFFAAVGIGAAIAALTYTITALVADVPFSVGGLVKATFIGAASSAVTFGIGSASTTIFSNFYSQAAFQAVAHGTFQGSMTAISGGKFWSGFAAGALSSIAASAWSGGTTTTKYCDGVKGTVTHAGLGKGTGDIGMIAFGTVSGGVGAQLTGGNFWQGAVTGLVVSGLNHFAHSSSNKLEKEYTINGKTYDHQGLKEYFATVIGEASNNTQEAQGIGEVILNRIDDQGATLTEGFIDNIGGVNQYDAIGGKIYNEIMKMKLYDIIDMKPENSYYNRSIGASKALSNWWHLKPGITDGAFFWNATWQKDQKNVGANWRAYNKGTFCISAQYGQTTFFQYSDSNKHWP